MSHAVKRAWKGNKTVLKRQKSLDRREEILKKGGVGGWEINLLNLKLLVTFPFCLPDV